LGSSLYKLSAQELLEGYKKNEFTPVEVVKCFLERIKQLDNKVKAFITVDEKNAIEHGQRLQDMQKNGKCIGKLFGIPVAIKDNICTKGLKTTCASRMLENFIPPYDATVVEKIKKEGGIIIGKTNMDEFAMGSATTHSAFFPTCNPHNLEYVPGGSSGGSAAAVACGFAPVALGSDTGGSIRQPASFCGVFGFKPTYGLVSRYGLIAFASSLDQIGPMARNTYDLALLLEVIAGYDKKDSTSLNLKQDFLRFDISKKYRIAVFNECVSSPNVEEEIRKGFNEVLHFLERKGHTVQYVDFEYTEYGIPCYYLIATSEASSNLARYTGTFFGERVSSDDFDEMFVKSRSRFLGKEVKRRILLGTFALSSGYKDEFYIKALKVRKKIFLAFQDIFSKFDFVLIPTSPVFPFRIDEEITDPLKLYYCDIFTVFANLANLPALNIPMFSDGIKQAGLQIIGNLCQDIQVLNLGYILEKELNLRRDVVELE
jgi:aspartyl-tRNA(Asn)/glutamyl-tRNA(Gln) amidotransferase subunit A